MSALLLLLAVLSSSPEQKLQEVVSSSRFLQFQANYTLVLAANREVSDAEFRRYMQRWSDNVLNAGGRVEPLLYDGGYSLKEWSSLRVAAEITSPTQRLK